jgi:hypothetical protein
MAYITDTQLAADDGSSLVGYTAAATGAIPRTVEEKLQAVIDVLDFGADPTGGTNSTDAFAAASAAINAAGGGTLIIPAGEYRVGKQTFAGSAGQSWSYIPQPIITISNCSRAVEVLGWGAKLVCASGLKFGSFNPVTGAAYSPPSLPFTNPDYRATPYTAMVGIYNCSAPVAVSGLELDGNVAALTLGGQWNDTGIQIPCSGIEAYGNANLSVERVHSHHHGLDGIQIGYVGLDENDPKKPHRIESSAFEFNGRQGLSWVGGNDLTVSNCRFAKTGRSAVSSAPGAGVDIEAENSICRNGVFINSEFVDNLGVGLISHSGSNNADFTCIRCKVVGTTTWSCWPNDPGWKFHDCLFVGTLTNPWNDADPERAAQFHSCRFSAATALSETGTVYSNNYLVAEVAAGNALYSNCRFDSDGNTSKGLIFSNGGRFQNCSFHQDGPGLGVYRGMFTGINEIVTAGSVDTSGAAFRDKTTINGVEQSVTSPRFSYLRGIGNNGSQYADFHIGFHYNSTMWAGIGARKGDLIFNANPNAGSVLAWRCTAAGNPGAWEALHGIVRQSAIAPPTGGSVVDTEGRAAINAMRAALTASGVTL